MAHLPSASFPRKREPMNTHGAIDALSVVMGLRLRGGDRWRGRALAR